MNLRVKDMSRRQQKAVFASFGKGSVSTGSDRDKILKKEFPQGDFDGDGVKNKDDCRPMDKNKQDLTGKLIKATQKTIVAYQKSKTPEARIKKAKQKLAVLKAKERAERLEAEAKAAEREYQAKHPKRFGIF